MTAERPPKGHGCHDLECKRRGIHRCHNRYCGEKVLGEPVAEPVPADLDALRAAARGPGRSDQAHVSLLLDQAAAELAGARQKVADLQAELDATKGFHWYSICSAHLEFDASCSRCNAGSWIACAAEAEAAALRTALEELADATAEAAGDVVVVHGEFCISTDGCTCDADAARIRAAHEAARAALSARPEATEGADDPVRRSSARPEEASDG